MIGEGVDVIRCPWAGEGLMQRYHDEEWGVLVHDDRALFEMLVLDGAQAGLSWSTILARREGYRRAFGGFDIGRAAAYGDADVERLLSDAGIIRNRSKVVAAIANARAVLAIQQEGNSFDSYVWSFVGGRTLQHQFQRLQDIPPATEESEALSQDLRRRGFKFVGPTICYAFMQSAGLVNDHLVDCFRYQTLANVPPAR
jgi:DNA-3-methyladenine glycosylase I